MRETDDRIRAAGDDVLALLDDLARHVDDGESSVVARELGRRLAAGAASALVVEALVTAGSTLLVDLTCRREAAAPERAGEDAGDSGPLFTYKDETGATRVLY
jgi:hypothetical protein